MIESKTGFAVWTTVSVIIAIAFVVCPSRCVLAQDDVEVGQKAFAKKNYPWYDADQDAAKRVELRERPAARSYNRSNIPLKPFRKNPAANNWNWNFGSSFFGGLSFVAWTVIIAVVVAVAAILFWAFLRIGFNEPERIDDVPRRSIAESIEQLPFELDAGFGDFRQLAEHWYQSGDYQKAMIYLFSHVLVSLDQKGLIRLRKGKTNRQYLRELRALRPLANYFQRVMVPFESVFFGDHELDKQDFETCWNQLGDFQAGVEQTSQVAHV